MPGTGKTYELNTIGDIVRLYCELPEDRATLMLQEVVEGIQMGAAGARMIATTLKTLSASLGGEEVDIETLIEEKGVVWIDDDGGNIDANFKLGEGENETITFSASKKQSEETVHAG